MMASAPTKSNLIRSSFKAVMSTKPELVEDFYTRLFVVAPEVRDVLPKTTQEQTEHLESMLQLALVALDMQEALIAPLHAMGEEYAKLGMLSGQHHMINEALMDTLAAQIGDDWTPQISSAWTSVLTFISSKMIEGAHNISSQDSATDKVA